MQKTILYAVLNWGLGHATRSIPIIKYLLAQDYKLIVCSDGDSLQLLKKEFSTPVFIKAEGYNTSYAHNENEFYIALAKQIPKYIHVIRQENKLCSNLCASHQVDYIISDNRYGFYHKTIPSAFICHQTFLPYPTSRFFEKLVNASYRKYLAKFSQIWVPDLAPPHSLSGVMSSGNFNNKQFIGIDSRFEPKKAPIKYQFLALLSGPEPQRTLLEEKLLAQLRQIEGKHLLIRGSTSKTTLKPTGNIEVKNLTASKELEEFIAKSAGIICRSGYTSIMDLLKLNKKAILIPTPGQPEQELLAKNVAEKKWFVVQKQDALNLAAAINVLSKCNLPNLATGYDFKIINDFLIS